MANVKLVLNSRPVKSQLLNLLRICLLRLSRLLLLFGKSRHLLLASSAPIINGLLSLFELKLEIIDPVLEYVIDVECLLPLLLIILISRLQLFDYDLFLIHV